MVGSLHSERSMNLEPHSLLAFCFSLLLMSIKIFSLFNFFVLPLAREKSLGKEEVFISTR